MNKLVDASKKNAQKYFKENIQKPLYEQGRKVFRNCMNICINKLIKSSNSLDILLRLSKLND